MLNRGHCLAKLLIEVDDIMTAQEEKFLERELNNLLNLSFKSTFSLLYFILSMQLLFDI